jgi:hypothetical protein
MAVDRLDDETVNKPAQDRDRQGLPSSGCEPPRREAKAK